MYGHDPIVDTQRQRRAVRSALRLNLNRNAEAKGAVVYDVSGRGWLILRIEAPHGYTWAATGTHEINVETTDDTETAIVAYRAAIADVMLGRGECPDRPRCDVCDEGRTS